MRIYDGKTYRDMTAEEIAEMEAQAKATEQHYWQNTPYDEAVNAQIRKRYTESQEFALLRQREEKPDEYSKYYDYCESCKAYAKQKKEEFGWQ